MPGLAAWIWRLTLVVPPPRLSVAGTELPGTTSQGTWKEICCWPFGNVPMARTGAPTLLMVNLAFELASGMPGKLGVAFGKVSAVSTATTAAMLQGESELGCWSAPFTKLPAVMSGAGGSTVNWNVWLPIPVARADTGRNAGGAGDTAGRHIDRSAPVCIGGRGGGRQLDRSVARELHRDIGGRPGAGRDLHNQRLRECCADRSTLIAAGDDLEARNADDRHHGDRERHGLR